VLGETRTPSFQQLAGDPRVAPARVLARQAQDELAYTTLDGRTAWSPPWLRPLPAHELAVPAQQRLRRHDQAIPAPPRQHSDERRQEGTVRRSERGTRLLPREYQQLMPQHEQFDVFCELAATASDKRPQESREREIGEREEHPPMLPEPTISSVQSWNPGFETPQASRTTRSR
jgi:hypothetical protein